jgi:hypothetical protein
VCQDTQSAVYPQLTGAVRCTGTSRGPEDAIQDHDGARSEHIGEQKRQWQWQRQGLAALEATYRVRHLRYRTQQRPGRASVWGGDLLGVAGMLGNCSSPLRKHPASREISDVQANALRTGKALKEEPPAQQHVYSEVVFSLRAVAQTDGSQQPLSDPIHRGIKRAGGTRGAGRVGEGGGERTTPFDVCKTPSCWLSWRAAQVTHRMRETTGLSRVSADRLSPTSRLVARDNLTDKELGHTSQEQRGGGARERQPHHPHHQRAVAQPGGGTGSHVRSSPRAHLQRGLLAATPPVRCVCVCVLGDAKSFFVRETLRDRWVRLRARWVSLRARRVTLWQMDGDACRHTRAGGFHRRG